MWQAVWKVVHLADPLLTAAMGRLWSERMDSALELASVRAARALRALMMSEPDPPGLQVQIFILPKWPVSPNDSSNEPAGEGRSPPTTTS